ARVIAAAPPLPDRVPPGDRAGHIDVAYCTAHGIPVTNCPDYCVIEVAEHALALLLIGVVWMLTDRTELPSVGEMNRRAPDISLPTLAGDELRLSDYRGQVVLVNFWGTWCEPCIRETPALQAAYTELKDQGLVIVGVNLTDDEIRQGNSLEDVQAFVDQFQVSYPIALDMEGEATRAFRVFPLPTSFFIDRRGIFVLCE
ncbi:MAG: redoxin domain-containing protein, partial [Chloroflexaceae bacterium]|nr:redoxin domain-containing protein [Chloroflexaceae bacterium]